MRSIGLDVEKRGQPMNDLELGEWATAACANSTDAEATLPLHPTDGRTLSSAGIK